MLTYGTDCYLTLLQLSPEKSGSTFSHERIALTRRTAPVLRKSLYEP